MTTTMTMSSGHDGAVEEYRNRIWQAEKEIKNLSSRPDSELKAGELKEKVTRLQSELASIKQEAERIPTEAHCRPLLDAIEELSQEMKPLVQRIQSVAQQADIAPVKATPIPVISIVQNCTPLFASAVADALIVSGRLDMLRGELEGVDLPEGPYEAGCLFGMVQQMISDAHTTKTFLITALEIRPQEQGLNLLIEHLQQRADAFMPLYDKISHHSLARAIAYTESMLKGSPAEYTQVFLQNSINPLNARIQMADCNSSIMGHLVCDARCKDLAQKAKESLEKTLRQIESTSEKPTEPQKVEADLFLQVTKQSRLLSELGRSDSRFLGTLPALPLLKGVDSFEDQFIRKTLTPAKGVLETAKRAGIASLSPAIADLERHIKYCDETFVPQMQRARAEKRASANEELQKSILSGLIPSAVREKVEQKLSPPRT